MFRRSLTAGLMVALLGSTAFAQTAPAPDAPPPAAAPEARGPMMPMMRGFDDARALFGSREGLDADADGKVTAAEIEAARDARFATLDADGDGAVSAAEIMAAADAAARAEREEALAKLVNLYDTNGDGVLQADELPLMAPWSARRFAGLDADGDGQISAAEYAAGEMARPPVQPRPMGERGPRAMGQHGSAMGWQPDFPGGQGFPHGPQFGHGPRDHGPQGFDRGPGDHGPRGNGPRAEGLPPVPPADDAAPTQDAPAQ